MIRALAVAFAVVLLPELAAAQPAAKLRVMTPTEVLAKVDGTYASAKQVSASFTQTVVNTTIGMTTVTTGDVHVRPGKMRWDYKTKKQSLDKSFIFDGTTLWVVEHANRQVLKHTVVSGTMPAAISFLTGGGSLSKEFSASAPKDKGQLVPGAVVVELTPKQPSAQYTQLLLVIDSTTWTVTRSIVTDPSGASNTFDFTAVNVKATQGASIFMFNPQSLPTYRIVKVGPPTSQPSRPPRSGAPAPAPKK